MNKKVISSITLVVLIISILSIYLILQKKSPDNISFSTAVLPIISEETPESYFYNGLTLYEWIWKETHNGTGPNSLSGGKITPKKLGVFKIVFDKNGNINGTTDCNNFNGTYTLNKSVIAFGQFALTSKFCDGSQEQEFLSMIRQGSIGIGETNMYIEHTQSIIFEKGKMLNIN